MKNVQKIFTTSNILLIAILIGAFLFRFININFNSPFLDEAIYIMRGLSILSGNIEENIDAISWIGGFPFVYPFLSGIFYSIGGILGARFFSVVLGTVSVYLLYVFTKQLLFFKAERLNQFAGLAAAGLMATAGVAITTSRFANYDALSFVLFLWGVVLWHKSIYSGDQMRYFKSAVVLFLSFLAKYSVIIFFPFLVLIPFYLAWKRDGKKSAVSVLETFALPLSFLTFGYIGLNFSNLAQFVTEQAVGSAGSTLEVLQIFWDSLALPLLLSLIGAVFLWRTRRLLVVLLFGLALIPLVVHVATNNTGTAQQQTFLSLIFLLPIAGGLLAKIAQRNIAFGAGALLLMMGLSGYFALNQMQEAETFWPNSTKAVETMHTDIGANDRILAEGGDVFALGLRDKITEDKVIGPFVFEYASLEGMPAYLAAVKNKYFKYIQLEGTYFDEASIAAITKQLEASKYKKVYGEGSIVVYKLQE